MPDPLPLPGEDAGMTQPRREALESESIASGDALLDRAAAHIAELINAARPRTRTSAADARAWIESVVRRTADAPHRLDPEAQEGWEEFAAFSLFFRRRADNRTVEEELLVSDHEDGESVTYPGRDCSAVCAWMTHRLGDDPRPEDARAPALEFASVEATTPGGRVVIAPAERGPRPVLRTPWRAEVIPAEAASGFTSGSLWLTSVHTRERRRVPLAIRDERIISAAVSVPGGYYDLEIELVPVGDEPIVLVATLTTVLVEGTGSDTRVSADAERSPGS